MTSSPTRRAAQGPFFSGRITVGAILLASYPVTPLAKDSTERTVTFATYAVPAPVGDGWEVTRDATKETVSFRSTKATSDGHVPPASSFINVFKVPFGEEGAAMSEDALANGFLEREHQGMLEMGVARHQYRLGEVKRAVETVGGRKLYTMRYTTEPPRPGTSPYRCEAALFLHVPVDYVARRAFYGFHVQECWEAATGTPPGLGRVEPVIAGLVLVGETPPAKLPPAPQPGRAGCPDVEGAPGAAGVVRWGMTADEVLAAFPGEAVRASPAELKEGKGPVRIEHCEIAGTDFRAEFFFYRDSRLTRVGLYPSSKRDASRPLFDRLSKALTERHGRPTSDNEDRTLGFANLRQADRSWTAADASISLAYMYGGGEPHFGLHYDAPRRRDADKK